ncbi:hypothetical protein L1276_002553 [Flavobacterium sp. HSC-32F16]|uniref:ParB N-terminal domain-containing protein n=1 Tax=Flavobacterium sp. HSC-32F16 TaxID=2910964 RepID=UPI0020A25236|nr:ParB N-terminal domain-containing protein [Flavobacterium sp. HSC-32F16]MCP2027396.1 hypothetical protein [Flavobacterium sp. HSC-32F16]
MSEISMEEASEMYNKIIAGIAEGKRLRRKAKGYKRRTKAGNLLLDIQWAETLDMKMLDALQTPFEDDYKQSFLDEFTVINLNLENVVAAYCDVVEDVFPCNNLWTIHTDESIARLIETIEKGTQLVPPILNITNAEVNIVDGKHRVALCRYLGLQTIPFLVKNDQLALAQRYV